jgi:hypothetical protein
MKGRWDTAPPPSSHTGQTLRVRMLNGKHAGQEVTILDIPHVTQYHADPQRITILLPGMTGDGIILKDNPQQN